MGEGISPRAKKTLLQKLLVSRSLSNINADDGIKHLLIMYKDALVEGDDIFEILNSIAVQEGINIQNFIDNLQKIEHKPNEETIDISELVIDDSGSALTLDDLIDPIASIPISSHNQPTIEMRESTRNKAIKQRSEIGTYSNLPAVIARMRPKLVDDYLVYDNNSFVGDYTIVGEAGRGAFGEVYFLKPRRAIDIKKVRDSLIDFLKSNEAEKSARRKALKEQLKKLNTLDELTFKTIGKNLQNKWLDFHKDCKKYNDGNYNLVLKLMKVDEDADSNKRIDRYEREIFELVASNHPNIVRVLDAGRANDERGKIKNFIYYVMEELSETLYQEKKITDDEFEACGLEPCNAVININQDLEAGTSEEIVVSAVTKILDVLYGLDYLHNHRGILHRDIKLDNILIGLDGKVKLLDIGLAKKIDTVEESLALTMKGTAMGSPLNMAPEIWRDTSENSSPGSDIYAVGVCLYQLITDYVPHTNIEYMDSFEVMDIIKKGPFPVWPENIYKAEEQELVKLEKRIKKLALSKDNKKINEREELEKEFKARKVKLNITDKQVVEHIDDYLKFIMMKMLHPVSEKEFLEKFDNKKSFLKEGHRYGNTKEVIRDLEGWLELYKNTKIVRDNLPLVQSQSMVVLTSKDIIAEVESEMKFANWYKRRGRARLAQRAKKQKKKFGIAGLITAGLLSAGLIFSGFSDKDPEDAAYDDLVSMIQTAEQKYNDGNIDEAYRLIMNADDVIENIEFYGERFSLISNDIDSLEFEYGLEFYKNNIKTKLEEGIVLRSKGKAIAAEEIFENAKDLLEDAVKVNNKYRNELAEFVEEINNELEINKGSYIKELANANQLDKEKLLNRLTDYKIEDLLKISNEEFPHHVEDGEWKLKSIKHGTKLGSSIKLMLDIYSFTGDEKYLDSAVARGNLIIDSVKYTITSGFGSDYVNAFVNLYEVTGREKYSKAIVDAGTKMLERFKDFDGDEFLVAAFENEISAYSLDDSILLYYAFMFSGNEKFISKFKNNLDTITKFNIKNDGSVYGRIRFEGRRITERIGSNLDAPQSSTRMELVAQVINTYTFGSYVDLDNLKIAENAADFLINEIAGRWATNKWVVLWDDYYDKNENNIAGAKSVIALQRLAQREMEEGNEEKGKKYLDASENVLKKLSQSINFKRTAGILSYGRMSKNYLPSTSFMESDSDYISALIGLNSEKIYSGGFRSDMLKEGAHELAWENSTAFKIYKSGENLILEGRCNVDNLEDAIKNSPTEWDGEIYKHEAFGLRIESNGKFKEILVAPNKNIYDSKGRFGKGWDSDSEIEVKLGDNQYYIKIKVPITNLGVSGDIRFNIVRINDGEISTFEYEAKDPHNIKRGETFTDDDIKYALLRR